MKRLNYLIFLCVLTALWSCGPKPGVTPTQLESADQLFQVAEEQYQAKSYEDALNLFQDYLGKYPDEALAPAALMKIGIINSSLGNLDEARQAYQQLVSQYPTSTFAQDAYIEYLYSFDNGICCYFY